MALRGAGQPKSKSSHSADTPSSRFAPRPLSADFMSIRNSRSQTETGQPHPPPHTRLALSVIECAVKDIKHDDESLHTSAVRFLNGSEDFYFWAQVLEQDSNWLLRRLRLRLRQDSPRAYERLGSHSRVRFHLGLQAEEAGLSTYAARKRRIPL